MIAMIYESPDSGVRAFDQLSVKKKITADLCKKLIYKQFYFKASFIFFKDSKLMTIMRKCTKDIVDCIKGHKKFYYSVIHCK